MTLEHIFGLTVSGLTVGMIYALIALGYTMVYGVLQLINFAHGEIFTIGGYLATSTLIWIGVDATTPLSLKVAYFGLALLLSIVLTALLGFLIERVAYRPLRQRSRIIALLSAIGVSIFLQNGIVVVFGPQPIIMPTAVVPTGFIEVFGARIRVLQIAIILISLVLMGALTWIVKGTRMGKAMRATSQDREAAEMMGIETNLTISFTFVIGSALAAIGGFLVAMYYGSLQFNTGFLYGLKAFTAAVLGGIGNIPGAVVGSLVLGLAENWGVGLNLGILAWLFVAGLLLGLYFQFVRAPQSRIDHIAEEFRTPAYERAVRDVYRFAPVVAVKTLFAERTDALLHVSAQHAVRLTAANVILAGLAVLFFINGDVQFASKWQHVISFAVLMAILMFRPSGILGENIQEKV
ncbi:MAG: branched-chain amino acid ABC transporter permease [Anaerosomatales bacterium]|nr:branched-chain amino acid ABC transporter permease [Anaerosomatales bacterium]MDT8434800.1 branched-chain amino acid ABC transporter permease [Anaerosomatales bacterium]